MPPRIENQTETPGDELQPEDTNPGNMQNAEPLHKAPKEGENQANDKGEAQSSKVDPPLAFVSYSKETKQSPHGKASDGSLRRAVFLARADGEYSMRTSAPAKPNAER